MHQKQLGIGAAIILAAGVFACTSNESGGAQSSIPSALNKDECGPPFLVADLTPGANSTNIRAVAHLGDTLVFTIFDGSRFSLWRSDGTAAGTVPIHDAFNGGPSQLQVAAGRIYFAADEDGSTGVEPWISDGTRAGTVMLKDINPGPDPSGPGEFVERAGKVYFTPFAPELRGQLWVTDGTEAGTTLVTTIDASIGVGTMVAVPGGNLFFFANDGVHGLEPWTSDGTAAGTQMLRDIRLGPDGSVSAAGVGAGGLFFFVADDGFIGREVWKSNGAGAEPLIDLAPRATSSNPFSLRALGDRLVFIADDGVSGQETWISDGTAAGTHLLVDVNPGPASSFPGPLTVAQDRVYFPAFDGVHGKELWVSDGREGHLVKDIVAGPTGAFPGDPNDMYAVEKSVVFDVNDRVNGDELWWSVGNANKTQFADIVPGPQGSFPAFFQRAGSLLYFIADDGGPHGRELWAVPVACITRGIPAQ
jgi:ELWxxDGT repeat protein